MGTSHPAARSSLSRGKAFTGPFDAVGARLDLLCGLDPTDPFVTGKRRDVLPCGEGFWFAKEKFFEVDRKAVSNAS